MKLHLGSGGKRLSGYTNVDIRHLEGVDIIEDVSTLHSFKCESIDEIYVSHVLEHFKRFEYIEVLRNWHRVLKVGGKLKIAVPDIEAVFDHYQKNRDLKILRGFLWGGQTYAENFHYCGWDFESLRDDLEVVGFSNIRRYDWRMTDHSHVDDFSQCYLPHMDKDNGKLMSLNVECLKM